VCNGLGDPKKLKRLLLKVNVLVNNGCIVFLQETNIVDTKYLEMIWKHSFLSNCVKTNSAGVIILYNKQYNLVHKYADHEGRQLIAVLGNDERKFIVVNAYHIYSRISRSAYKSKCRFRVIFSSKIGDPCISRIG
jgi:16S rRNA U516 pseudouridylate synthase RsuA-like enzyme